MYYIGEMATICCHSYVILSVTQKAGEASFNLETTGEGKVIHGIDIVNQIAVIADSVIHMNSRNDLG